MADIPSFEDFKKSQPAIPSFEDFKKQQTATPQQSQSEGWMSKLPEPLSSIALAPGRGLREAGEGIKALKNPGFDAKAAALHQVIGGASQAAMPFALPAVAAAPFAAAGAAGLGALGSVLGEGGAHLLHAGPGVSSIAGDVGGAVGGGLGGKVGGIVRKAAAPLAESALGIRGAAREYGATPGKAILEETKGVKPATVEQSAQSKVGELTNELEGKARAAKSPVSLAPARGVVNGAINSAQAGNSVPRELFPIREHLEVPHKGFGGAVDQPTAPIPDQARPSTPILDRLGMSKRLDQAMGGGPLESADTASGPFPRARIAENQQPLVFLGMKRRLGTDFTNFRPGQSTPESVDVANRVYGQMARDFNQAVPGGEALNQRIQSLLPVIKRAHVESLNAGPGERFINRATRPTGGLAAPLFALHEAGLPGLFSAIGGQEALGSPTLKMVGARGIHGFGGPMKTLPAGLIGERQNH